MNAPDPYLNARGKRGAKDVARHESAGWIAKTLIVAIVVGSWVNLLRLLL